MNKRSGITWAKLVLALGLMCLTFSFGAMAQANVEKPLDKAAVSALLGELKAGLPDLTEDEDQINAITEKWAARKDLAGKTRPQILSLLFADVRSIIDDKETQDSIWKEWTGSEKSDEETPVKTPQTPTAQPPNTPPKPAVADKLPNDTCVGDPNSKMTWGKVKWFNDPKGFGIITPGQGGTELFFTYRQLLGTLRSPAAGLHVEFRICVTPKGRQAFDVQEAVKWDP